jgi:hypothetical protein
MTVKHAIPTLVVDRKRERATMREAMLTANGVISDALHLYKDLYTADQCRQMRAANRAITALITGLDVRG